MAGKGGEGGWNRWGERIWMWEDGRLSVCEWEIECG